MAAFQRASWHWPTNGAATGEEHIDPQVGDASTQSPQEQGQQPHNADEAGAAPPPQRHYPPRQCRICLEEVLPTFETPAGGLAAVLNPTPNVRYISSDPESGRLIRPCKCRGSQQYVHEGCLQQWRHSDPGMRNRYYWECPTCKFQYRLERMRWARYISSTFTQIIHYNRYHAYYRLSFRVYCGSDHQSLFGSFGHDHLVTEWWKGCNSV